MNAMIELRRGKTGGGKIAVVMRDMEPRRISRKSLALGGSTTALRALSAIPVGMYET